MSEAAALRTSIRATAIQLPHCRQTGNYEVVIAKSPILLIDPCGGFECNRLFSSTIRLRPLIHLGSQSGSDSDVPSSDRFSNDPWSTDP
jgi:hypothetical protein